MSRPGLPPTLQNGPSGGRIVGAPIGSAGMRAVALAGSKPGQLKDGLARGRVPAAPLPGSREPHPAQLINPPPPGFPFHLIAAAPGSQRAIRTESLGKAPPAHPAPATRRAGPKPGQAGASEPVQIAVQLGRGVTEEVTQIQLALGEGGQSPVHPAGMMSQPRCGGKHVVRLVEPAAVQDMPPCEATAPRSPYGARVSL